ncbi:hypothetical protein BPAE_0297g00060 [Botrytis paeoniae]|uniref:2EXR domain-containing protein n=1 Tax=Botrytis paeoniae TaxID=278948 RepID=A0A4Z1FFM5_9HELO|nr:hypothetical protein BPAE_0297g00060 [Botrytis paeoniae]
MTPVSAPVVPNRNATFHPFSRLPLEIRRIIWRAAPPGPRNVALKRFCLKNPEYPIARSKPNSWRTFLDQDVGAIRGFASRDSNPTIFYTCRESLEVASETYTLTFGSWGVEPRTWLKYDIDSVHLDMSFTATRLQCFSDNIDDIIGMLTLAPITFLSLNEIDGLDGVSEVVFMTPEVDGISRSVRLDINSMKTYSGLELY